MIGEVVMLAGMMALAPKKEHELEGWFLNPLPLALDWDGNGDPTPDHWEAFIHTRAGYVWGMGNGTSIYYYLGYSSAGEVANYRLPDREWNLGYYGLVIKDNPPNDPNPRDVTVVSLSFLEGVMIDNRDQSWAGASIEWLHKPHWQVNEEWWKSTGDSAIPYEIAHHECSSVPYPLHQPWTINVPWPNKTTLFLDIGRVIDVAGRKQVVDGEPDGRWDLRKELYTKCDYQEDGTKKCEAGLSKRMLEELARSSSHEPGGKVYWRLWNETGDDWASKHATTGKASGCYFFEGQPI